MPVKEVTTAVPAAQGRVALHDVHQLLSRSCTVWVKACREGRGARSRKMLRLLCA